MAEAREVLLELKDLTKVFRSPAANGLLRRIETRAVGGVSLRVYRGESYGIVGESGCGKSTVAKLIMGLERPTSGEVWLEGQRIDTLPERRLRGLRTGFQMVFQDSGSSLNPRKRVEDLLSEPMRYHRVVPSDRMEARVEELLELVGLTAEHRDRYPHELSGGQRQRICIARALSLQPRLIILDEPVSALDVSVQAQILNLLRELQQRLGLTYIFIGHGLGAVHYVSDRIGVMYMGRMVEEGDSTALFRRPCHPYTQALLDAAPIADRSARSRARITLTGEVGRTAPESGCPFRDRCPAADPGCATAGTALMDVPNEPGRRSACMRILKRETGGERA